MTISRYFNGKKFVQFSSADYSGRFGFEISEEFLPLVKPADRCPMEHEYLMGALEHRSFIGGGEVWVWLDVHRLPLRF